MRQITCVTTCKGRLHHLEQSIPRLVEAGFERIVVVDYACPDGTAAWLKANFAKVVVVEVSDDPGFSASRARNLGAAVVDTEWIFFVDADILVEPGFAEWAQSSTEKGNSYRAGLPGDGRRPGDVWGSFICERSAFELIGGFDEVIRGWGGEDVDFFEALRLSGVVERHYPIELVKAIGHSDSERFRFDEIKSRSSRHAIFESYIHCKKILSGITGVKYWDLNVANRQVIWREVGAAVLRWENGGRVGQIPFELNMTLKPRPMMLGGQIESQISMNFIISPKSVTSVA